MRELIEHILKQLVDSPGEVSVTEVSSGGAAILEVRLAEPDRKHAIGKDGRMVNSLRTIATAMATRHRRRVMVEILG